MSPATHSLLLNYKARAAAAPEKHGVPIRHRGEVSGLLVPALAPLDAADLEQLSAWRNQHRSAFFSEHPVTTESTARWLAGIAAQSNRILFLITTSGKVVGHIGLADIDEAGKVGESDAWLGVGDPGVPGIMVLGFAAMLGWAFDSLSLEAIRARVFTDNQRVLRAHALLRYRIEGEVPYAGHDENGVRSWRPGEDGPIRPVTQLTLDRASFRGAADAIASAIRPRSGDRARP